MYVCMYQGRIKRGGGPRGHAPPKPLDSYVKLPV